MAGGIGPTTDAIIVDATGARVVEESTMKVLLEVYNEREYGAERKAVTSKIAELKLETHQLDIS
jgi:hypothetical protein